MRCWLRLQSGDRRLVDGSGLLIGRHRSCDLVIDDARVSRQQALVRLGTQGPELVHLGRNEVLVNQAPSGAQAELEHGDSIELPDGTCLQVELQAQAEEVQGFWVLEDPQGGLHGLTHFPFIVGGGAGDCLCLQGWPSGALVISSAQGAVFLEAAIPARLGADPVDAGTVAQLQPGSEIHSEKGTLRLRWETEDGTQATVALTAPPPIDHIALRFLPSGGELKVSSADGEVQVYLPERRFALVLTLLSPADGQEAGEVISDETVCARVWPRDIEKGRVHVNVLLQRARRDLIKAGLDGFRLLVRDGGGTRFAVPVGVDVVVD
jgi:pSer/pThr/pTyr-binding forkhead associated (FHA) protein